MKSFCTSAAVIQTFLIKLAKLNTAGEHYASN